MLSRIDIEKELGKDINIYPFNYKHFKENSINLTVGDYAWTLSNGTVYYDEKSEVFSIVKPNSKYQEIKFSKGSSAIFSSSKNDKYVILLPQSTTLIETKETLAVGAHIGGTYHSKVGIVSQGIGHIGTMLGPNFSGNSLIAIHNVTNQLLHFKVGESFVSVVFHYLKSAIYENNLTVSGHLDKMSELGIRLTTAEREDLGADWKGKIEQVRQKMLSSAEYNRFKKSKKNKWLNDIKKYINKRNFIILFILAIIIILLIVLAYYLDNKFSTNDWSNRCWNIIGSGILVTIIGGLIKGIGKR